ncbi:MAG: phage terminase Nu1 subunit (DNA packaging protein) [Glaciecola sp.]|jgi:phage terminase Nu1 subunit (DNA packaging protein)
MTTVNLQEASAILRKSPNTLKSWFKKGCPVKQSGNQNKEWQIIIADVVDWREKQVVENALADIPDDIDELKIRKLKAETLIVEIEAAKQRNEVAPVADIEKTLKDLFIHIRTRMLLIPSRVSQPISLNSNESEIKALLDDEIREVLSALSEEDT